ncbi:hypothetical protein ACFRQM_11990 [Streptomyces sp. NPDC056831]
MTDHSMRAPVCVSPPYPGDGNPDMDEALRRVREGRPGGAR